VWLPEPPVTPSDQPATHALADTILAGLILGFHIPYKDSPEFLGQGMLYKAYPWIVNFLYTPTAQEKFYTMRLVFAAKVANQMAYTLCRSKDSFDAFWAAYTTNKDVIDSVVEYCGQANSWPYLSEGTTIDALRLGVYNAMIPLTGAMATRGAPPNWVSAFPATNLIPSEVFVVLRRIEAEALGLLSAFDGVTSDVVSFIELLEKRIDALSALIEQIEAIVALLKSFQFPGLYVLYVPMQGGGIPGFISQYSGATGGPVPNEDDYTAGMVFLFGVPSLEPLFALIAG
jgi:hypothetical protein